MRREDLERYLERGDALGFQKETGDDAYIGWIMLSKRHASDRLIELFGYKPEVVVEEEYKRVCPYQVWVAEFRRDVYEGGECESADDYRLSKNYFFPSLDHVAEYVGALGHALEDIKWAREIDSN